MNDTILSSIISDYTYSLGITCPELGPLVLPLGPLFLYYCFLDSPMFRPTRTLLIWADGRAGEEIYVWSILLKVSWKDDISGPDRI